MIITRYLMRLEDNPKVVWITVYIYSLQSFER